MLAHCAAHTAFLVFARAWRRPCSEASILLHVSWGLLRLFVCGCLSLGAVLRVWGLWRSPCVYRRRPMQRPAFCPASMPPCVHEPIIHHVFAYVCERTSTQSTFAVVRYLCGSHDGMV